MDKAYKYKLLAICIIAIATRDVCCSDRRLKNRITNAEIKLDTINNDIAAFRLDMLDIWDKLDELNSSICLKNAPDTSVMTEPPIQQTSPFQKDLSQKFIHRAFQSEKKYLHNNIDDLKQGQQDIVNLVNKQSKNIDKAIGDIKTLNQDTTVFKKEQEKIIDNIITDTQALDKKFTNSITDIEHGQEAIVQRSLESFKETLQIITSQLNTMQMTIDKLIEKTACPATWHAYRDSCYYLGTSKWTWTQAKNKCQFIGAYLVEHNDEAEAKHLAEVVTSLGVWRDSNYYWTGATDISREGDWKWSTSHTSVTVRYWRSNQPDNYYNEDCMSSEFTKQGSWNDLDCNDRQNYMCERAKL